MLESLNMSDILIFVVWVNFVHSLVTIWLTHAEKMLFFQKKRILITVLLTRCRRMRSSGQRQPQSQRHQLRQLAVLPSQLPAAAPLQQARLQSPLALLRPLSRRAVTPLRPLLPPAETMMVTPYLSYCFIISTNHASCRGYSCAELCCEVP